MIDNQYLIIESKNEIDFVNILMFNSSYLTLSEF